MKNKIKRFVNLTIQTPSFQIDEENKTVTILKEGTYSISWNYGDITTKKCKAGEIIKLPNIGTVLPISGINPKLINL